MPLDFSRFEYLSFDCYGTLIDWESGLLSYLRPLLAGKGCVASDDQILNLYAEFEPREQSGGYRTYREVLASVVRDFAHELRFAVNDAEVSGLAESIAEWEPFPDTVPALRRLQPRFKLSVLSNIDNDLFQLTAPKLQVSLAEVVTAQQAKAYKPAIANFELLLQRLGIARECLLHVAESLYHDVLPARSLGIATVWVNRRQGKTAAASRLADVRPDLEVKNVAALADIAGC